MLQPTEKNVRSHRQNNPFEECNTSEINLVHFGVFEENFTPHIAIEYMRLYCKYLVFVPKDEHEFAFSSLRRSLRAGACGVGGLVASSVLFDVA